MTGPDPAATRVAARSAAALAARTPVGRAESAHATTALCGGVTSAWQRWRADVLWIDHGLGATIWDVDGNAYDDLHGGFGASIAGHAHPRLVAALGRQAARGTHFAQPTRGAVRVAELLAERFGLPAWRFASTGTEATLDAVHLMRATTGRPLVLKVDGHYHGHHDVLHLSVDAPPADPPWCPVPATAGLSAGAAAEVLIVPYGDLRAVHDALVREPGRVAGMILEPIAMNPVPIVPPDGYLAGIRAALHADGALLAFDEVQTGLTVHAGGATRLYGTQPDLVCLSKALGGGLPVAALGGTREAMAAIEDGTYGQVGTFNGNPLAMAAARCVLEEILTPEAHGQLDGVSRALADGARACLAEAGIEGHAVALGAKGCLRFDAGGSDAPRERGNRGATRAHAHWLHQLAHGVLTAPSGKWLVNVAHGRGTIDRYLANLRSFLAAL